MTDRRGNPNYRAGREWEYEVVRKIEEKSDDSPSTRTAGSHGKFDVRSIVPNPLRPTHGELLLIQAKKAKKITKTLEDEWEEIKGLVVPKHLIVKKQMWIKLPRKHVIAWGD